MSGPLRWPDSPTTRGHQSGPRPGRSQHEVPRSAPGPGLRLKGPRLAPALSALASPGGKMTAPRLGDGPKERRGKPPLHLPASAGMGRVVRGKRSTTPSPRGESLPRPTSRGGAEDPRLAPVPFAQSYRFVCSLIAPPRPSRARPCSECGSCPCPRWSIWGWDPKEAQHLGGGGLPDTLSAGSRNPIFAKARFREWSVQPGHPGSLPGKPSALKSPKRPFCPSPLCRKGPGSPWLRVRLLYPVAHPLAFPRRLMPRACRSPGGPGCGSCQRMWGTRCSGVSSPRDEHRSSVLPLPPGHPLWKPSWSEKNRRWRGGREFPARGNSV